MKKTEAISRLTEAGIEIKDGKIKKSQASEAVKVLAVDKRLWDNGEYDSEKEYKNSPDLPPYNEKFDWIATNGVAFNFARAIAIPLGAAADLGKHFAGHNKFISGKTRDEMEKDGFEICSELGDISSGILRNRKVDGGKPTLQL